jgi:putative NADPH-quinone reductase
MTAAYRILVLYAHPSPAGSRVNRRLAQAAGELSNVTLRDLYETYPDFDIDVQNEQALLAEADLVVFQHPIHWYSMPSLLKEWMDTVLKEGWAYGEDGTALRGKDFWLAATTDGPHEACQESSYHQHKFSVFLPPFEQTARLCGMRWLPPYILHGAHRVDNDTVNAHIDGYRERLATYPHWLDVVHARPPTLSGAGPD